MREYAIIHRPHSSYLKRKWVWMANDDEVIKYAKSNFDNVVQIIDYTNVFGIVMYDPNEFPLVNQGRKLKIT